jgi:hypothetical protein
VKKIDKKIMFLGLLLVIVVILSGCTSVFLSSSKQNVSQSRENDIRSSYAACESFCQGCFAGCPTCECAITPSQHVDGYWHCFCDEIRYIEK